MNSKTILKDCLNVWWYRPENALVIASYRVNGISFNKFNLKNSADFACGDGVNTFLKCGGSFDSEFDIFGHLTPSLSHKEIVKQKIDIFDLPDSKFKPLIKKRPKIKFSFDLSFFSEILKTETTSVIVLIFSRSPTKIL